MLNVCEACTKKEFSLPHIDPYSNSKVCNKCHLFLSSLSGPELQKIYAHLGNQSMINHGASSESSSQNRSFSTSEVDDRSVTPTRKKMFNLFGNAESGNKPLAKPTDTSRSLSPLRMLATPTGRSYSAVSPSNGNLISRAKFGATLPQREGSSSSPGQGGGSSVPTTGSNGNDSPGTNRQSFGQRSVPSPTISQQVATNSFGLSSSDPSRSTLLDRSPK